MMENILLVFRMLMASPLQREPQSGTNSTPRRLDPGDPCFSRILSTLMRWLILTERESQRELYTPRVEVRVKNLDTYNINMDNHAKDLKR